MPTADEFYTHGHDAVVVGAHAERSVATSAAFLIPRLADGLHLLDFGCGPGSITVDLAHRLAPSGSVVGVDSSQAALEIARHDAAAGNLDYVRGSVYDLPLPSDTFDIAYGHQVLQHLGDPVAALREVRRVLKPGGVVAVRDADYATMTHHPHQPGITRWLDLYHQVARANGGEPDAGRRLPEWVNDAGFGNPEVTTSTWTYAAPAARTSWAELWAERIALPRFRNKVVDLQLASDDDIAAIADAWRTWAAAPGGWFSFIHGEVIAAKMAD
ncbi:MAG: methyltransferase domain-containing protein [bacterium]|nr:methyltransferase domain-containing protein [bacterium]